MIRGIFNWLKKATKAKKIAAYDIGATSMRDSGFIIPEGVFEPGVIDMAESYAVTARADFLTQIVSMAHMEFIIHSLDERRFVLAKHQDGQILIFELEDTQHGCHIEVMQFKNATYFKLSNAVFIASTLNGETRAEDEATYRYYTEKLDPATLEIAA